MNWNIYGAFRNVWRSFSPSVTRDAANVLILPTFSVPLMTHGRTAFVQDDAEAARTQWRPHEETQSAQRERRLDHRAGLAQPLRIETAHDDLRADARRIAHGDGDRSPKRPPRRSRFRKFCAPISRSFPGKPGAR